MSAFLSGAAVECGPINVLKNVQSQLDRDYSLQQDRLVSTPNVAGSSRQPFRPQASAPAQPFIPQNVQSAQSPFDLNSLRQHLTPSPQPPQRQTSQAADQYWARAFNNHVQAGPSRPQEKIVTPRQTSGWGQEFAQNAASSSQEFQRTITPPQPVIAPWKRPLYQPTLPLHPQPVFLPRYQPPIHTQPYQPQYEPRSSSAPSEQTHTTAPSESLTDSQDILAKTAQTFVNELEGSSNILTDNPKLAQSKFMSLLRGLGDGKTIIDEGEQAAGEEVGAGARLVDRSRADLNRGDWASSFIGEQKKSNIVENGVPITSNPINGLGHRAGTIPSLDPYTTPPSYQNGVAGIHGSSEWESSFQDQEAIVRSSETSSRKSVHFDSGPLAEQQRNGVPNNLEEALRHTTSIPGMGVSWEEQGLDDFDDEVFMGFNGMMRQAPPTAQEASIGQKEGWGDLQEDWDEFQRTEPGSRSFRGMGMGDQTERYLFQRKNPYYGVSETTSYWEMESPTLKGVLELEAAVQNSPSSFEAWYNLGLKQQENEREESAILALSKTVQLEPEYRPAYLALAVSYTNEGEAEAACTMLEKWISLGETQGQSSVQNDITMDNQKRWNKGGRETLIERLIDIARKNPQEVDAEVQVALGVLFNATEEYQKAEDCFLAALDVRPDDWLLYNRLGATLANSGRSNEAIQYYHKALELHPNFVRALFNLGISYINLGQYPLAAQSALDALRLQHSDASEAYAFGQDGGSGKKSKGVTSEALWNALRTACIHMNRHDLVGLVEQRDLSGFPMNFDNAQYA